ncbi:MAG TPA: alpha/beta fold hydrolase, partial [Ktedonobacterales bacterium]|nr:alpha/beta fold hydrolase [Ktedonobacterales bacterium]
MSQSAGAISERAVVVGGVRLATAVNTVPREQLARPPLVVLPAANHAWGDYRPVLERFAGERRVAALDWPGFGNSDRPSPALYSYSATSYAALLATWMDALGMARAVFVAHSVGAAAALRLALDHPERVAGLALVAPAGFTPPGVRRALACRALGTPRLLAALEPALTALYLAPANPATRAILAEQRAARAAADHHASIAAYAALWRSFDRPAADLRAAVRSVTAPAIILRGALDPICTAAD